MEQFQGRTPVRGIPGFACLIGGNPADQGLRRLSGPATPERQQTARTG